LGIKNTIEETLDEVRLRLDEGFRRIKVKIQQGWDVALVKAIRKKFPDICLMLDANSDYSLKDLVLLKKLDQFNLLMLEQPLEYDDIVDHSILQQQIKTPICLDESILSAEDARKALYLGSCKTINIKPARVGGPLETIKIHNLCQKQKIPVWCGGLLETGIGRAFNIALASLPNFKYPADMSETKLFYQEDLVDDPYQIKAGFIDVPDKPGLGFKINERRIQKYTVDKEKLI
jgi:O-succinylbenzoate synthase